MAINRPLITLFTAATLLAGPPFADANGLTSSGTNSVDIANNSPYTFSFSTGPSNPITLQPYYGTTIPIPANTTYRVSYVSGSPTIATGTQGVTLQESGQATTYGTYSLGGNVPSQLATTQILQSTIGETYNLASNTFAYGTPFTPVNYLVHGYTVSAVLRGTSPGAAEAEVWVQAYDGNNVAFLYIGLVTEGQPVVVTAMLPTPWSPPLLAQSGNWQFRFFNKPIVGVVTMDVNVVLYYS